MWRGNTIYFISDRGEAERNNFWAKMWERVPRAR